jgi:hypothetical protein
MWTRHRVVLALLALPVTAALVACGTTNGADDKAAAGSAPASVGGIEDGSGDTASAVEPAPPDGDVPAARPAAATTIPRAVIASGALRLTTSHLGDSRQDAFTLVAALGGHVANEQSQSDSRGRLDRVDLTLRVPADSFTKALDDLAELGTVRHREQSTKDVTTQVIDTAARVKAQRASVESIERLLARAGTIGEVMSIERQLATRQAELDSLEQQQKWLADQTSLSTIQVTLTRSSAHLADDDRGLLSGLEAGWHALGRTAAAVVIGLGAVLPFAVVAAIVGVPVWLLLRRRRTVGTAAPPAAQA